MAVAASAIWGDWLRSRLAPAKVILIEHTPEGIPTLFSTGNRAMFYALKVVNRRPWMSVQNCRVMLVGFSRRDPGGIFQPVPMPFPCQFIWTPAEVTPILITLLKEHVLDLGYIEEHGDKFIPRLYATSLNFQGYVGHNEAVRYQLQIEATNFLSPIYVIEVAWDGIWDFVPATMRTHLPVRMITT